MKNPKIIFITLTTLLLLLSFNTSALAETDCDIDYNECKITITIKIAFAGATNQQIQDWADEIEDVWNGPNNYQTTGDCDCEVEFKVETMKITNPANVNCDPPPEGYHCVMVTPWNNNNNNLPWFYKPDGTKEYVVAYMGYNSQSPSQGGASINGWWSDQTSRPVTDGQGNPTGENYIDAAHEAGHMMGLDDDKGAPNIMGQTSGPNAQPTQEQIDQVVQNVCGDDACPDHCCCGNGEVDEDKGEECDPMAEDTKCGEGEYCCMICCQCHSQLCSPEDGEYATESDCQRNCEDGQCLYNYQTGCWDCQRYETRLTTIFNTTNLIRIGVGFLLVGILAAAFIFGGLKFLLITLGIMIVGAGSYMSPGISKFFEKPFEGFPSPEPSLEYAGMKETVAIFTEMEETPQGEVEGEEEEQPPIEEKKEEPSAEEEPQVEEPLEEELPSEEQPPAEEPPAEEPAPEPEVEKTACQITCEDAGFLDGNCQFFEEGIGSCEERGFFTPPFTDEYCEQTGGPGIFNVCCCILE